MKSLKTREPAISIFGKGEMVKENTFINALPQQVNRREDAMGGSLQIISFCVGGIAFGAEVEQIVSVIRMAEITIAPNEQDFFEGVINIRGQIIPVISLRKMFGMGPQKYELGMRIVVVEIGDKKFGLIVDEVSEVLEIRDISPLPSNISIHQLLLGVTMLQEKLVFILDLNKIFTFERKSVLDELKKASSPFKMVSRIGKEREKDYIPVCTGGKRESDDGNGELKKILHERALKLSRSSKLDTEEVKQLVVFSLGREFYGVEACKAEKICHEEGITPTPSTPDYVLGMMNLGGDILWVLDIKGILGLSGDSDEGKKPIVVLNEGELRVGFLTDAVLGVIDLPISNMGPPLATTGKVKAEYIDSEAKWNNDLIAIINSGKIIESITLGKG